MSNSVGRGLFRYYALPFLREGLTIRVDVSVGEVWCYASDVERNPNRDNHIWSFLITEYNDTNIDPGSLGREAGHTLFIAIEGINPSNNFTLNSTSGDTSITGIYVNRVNCKSFCIDLTFMTIEFSLR